MDSATILMPPRVRRLCPQEVQPCSSRVVLSPCCVSHSAAPLTPRPPGTWMLRSAPARGSGTLGDPFCSIQNAPLQGFQQEIGRS